jgi:hypothetical protein
MTTLAALWTWIITSRAGRAVAAGVGIALAIGLALLKAFSAGRSAERAKQDRASLENLRKRQQTDEEIRSLPASERRRRLSGWVSDE